MICLGAGAVEALNGSGELIGGSGSRSCSGSGGYGHAPDSAGGVFGVIVAGMDKIERLAVAAPPLRRQVILKLPHRPDAAAKPPVWRLLTVTFMAPLIALFVPLGVFAGLAVKPRKFASICEFTSPGFVVGAPAPAATAVGQRLL